ncbi:MAG: hypothetical protein BGO07_01285 [Alphaproteobacteria bacterium 40-19]|nr:MAG: hypothetical protein BGO07_01285 [Alphaproteobacteria bacterium 40-19]
MKRLDILITFKNNFFLFLENKFKNFDISLRACPIAENFSDPVAILQCKDSDVFRTHITSSWEALLYYSSDSSLKSYEFENCILGLEENAFQLPAAEGQSVNFNVNLAKLVQKQRSKSNKIIQDNINFNVFSSFTLPSQKQLAI